MRDRGARALRYRYCTHALAGRWRTRPGDAFEDAVRAGQAERDPASPDGCRWLVAGEIEARPLAEIKALGQGSIKRSVGELR